MKKEYKGGGFLKDLGMFALDAVATPAEILTGKNIVNPAYSGQGFETLGKGLTGVQSAATTAAPTALNMLVPGAGTALGMTQGVLGSNVQDNTLDRNQGAVDFGQMLGMAGNVAMPFMANGGDLTQYMNGGSHEENPNGGIPVGQKALVEEGETRNKDFIYSDRLKPKGSKKSFADLSKDIEKRYVGRERDAAANRAKQQALDTLAEEQESLKESQLSKELVKSVKNTAQQFAAGGFLNGDPNNTMPGNFWANNTNYGDYTNSEMRGPFTVTAGEDLTPEQQALLDRAGTTHLDINKLPMASIPGPQAPGIPDLFNNIKEEDPFLNEPMSDFEVAKSAALFEPEFTEDPFTNAAISQEEIDQTIFDNRDKRQPITGINPMGGASTFQQPGKDMLSQLVQENLNAAPEPQEMFYPDKTTGSQNAQDFLAEQQKYINRGTALASIPDLFNLMQAAKGPDDVNLERFTPEKIDLEEQRRQARDQSRMAQNIARENTRGTMSSGQAFAGQLATDVAINSSLQDVIGQSFMSEEAQNTQIANQAGLTNTQIANQEYAMREQNKALVDSLVSQSIAGLSQTGQGHFKDLGATMGQDRMNKLIINAINEGVLQDFSLDNTGGMKFKTTKKKKGE